MKKIITLIAIGALYANSFGQVTTIINSFTSNLSKNDLPFSGDRKLFATGLNDKNTKNIIVVSKNKIGAEDDKLFIEKFIEKSPKNYEKIFSEAFLHPINKSLAFVNNRMMYQDVDKDGNVEFIYIVDEHENGAESPLKKVYGVIVYNNNSYKIWSLSDDDFHNVYYGSNFNSLPQNVQNAFADFFKGLKKK